MPTSDNLTTSNHYLVNTESDVSEIGDQLSDSTITTATINNNNTPAVAALNTSSLTGKCVETPSKQQQQQTNYHLENEMPLSFASFYYSLKVIKGKGVCLLVGFFFDATDKIYKKLKWHFFKKLFYLYF
jgi:hypothetical protein